MNKPFLPLSREEIAIRALGLRRDPLAGEMIALEPRMVFDGAGMAVAADAAKQAADATDAAKTDAGKSTADAAAELAKTIAAAAAPAAPAPVPHEVVFIDSRVADIDAFRKTAGDNRLIIVVDAKEDGITKITDTLKGLHDISAVHIVDHGVDGSFELGKNWIGVDAIKSHEVDIKSWQAALTTNADILLYGCDVAKTTKGEELIKLLAQESGADVAASSDMVGRTDHGADWTLEKKTGEIETKLVAPEGYAYALAEAGQVTLRAYSDNAFPNSYNTTGATANLSVGPENLAANWTNDTTPRFFGTASAGGATVRLYSLDAQNNRTLLATVTAATNGNFQIEPDAGKELSEGTSKLIITQQYGAFTESPVVDASAFYMHIRLAPPPALNPAVNTIQINSGSKPLFVNGSDGTEASTFVINLTTAQLDRLFNIGGSILSVRFNADGTVKDSNENLITPTKDANGNYVSTGFLLSPLRTANYTPVNGLYDVYDSYFLYLRDSQGNYINGDGTPVTANTPLQKSAMEFRFHFYQLTSPVFGGLVDNAGPEPTKTITAQDVATDDPTPTFFGTNVPADAKFTVNITRANGVGVFYQTGVSPVFDANGNWSYTPDLTNLSDGVYRITLTSTLSSGLSSGNTRFSFYLDRATPTYTVSDKLGPVQTSTLTDSALVDGLTLTGTANKMPGSTLSVDVTVVDINLTRNGGLLTETDGTSKTVRYTTRVNADGTWNFAIPSADLGNGLKRISTKVTDSNQLSSTSSPVKVFLTGAWTPGGLGQSGLALWFDPAIASSVTKSSNGAVSQLLDLSGNGLNAKQANAANQPILTTDAVTGRTYLTFVSSPTKTVSGSTTTYSINSAVADFLSLAYVLSPTSIVYVGQASTSILGDFQDASTTTPFNVGLLGTDTNSFGFFLTGGATPNGIGANTSSGVTGVLADISGTQAPWLIGSIVSPWVTCSSNLRNQVMLNGAAAVGNGTTTSTVATFGSIGARFSGQMGAIIAYSRALTTAETSILANVQAQTYILPLASGVNDLYVVGGAAGASDAALQLTYDNDIGGILKDGASVSTAKTSAANGGLIITDKTFFANAGTSQAGIMFGNNGESAQFRAVAVNGSDNPGIIRFARSWAIDVTGGNGGKVDLSFDVASLAAQEGQTYQDVKNAYDGRKGLSLAWRANATDPWQVIATSDTDVLLSGGKVTFADLDVGANGLRDGFVTLMDGPTVKAITRTNVAVGPTDTVATFRVSLSEQVAGLTTSSFSALAGNLTVRPSVTSVGDVQSDGAGNFWCDVTVTYKTGSGYVGLDYDFTKITGVDTGTANAGNPMVKTAYARTDAQGLVDTDVPSPDMTLSRTLLGAQGSASGSAIVSINFNEPVTGFAADDLAILDANNNDVTANFSITADATNPASSAFGNAFKFTIAQRTANVADGVYKVRLKTASGNQVSWQDAASNVATDANTGNMVLSQAFTIDKVAPTIASITRTDASGNALVAPTRADALTFKVTFSEIVKNVNAADFVLVGPTTTQAADILINVIAFPGDASGTSYLVTLTDQSGKTTLANYNGSIGLGLAAAPTQNIADSVDNVLTTTLPTGDNNQAFTVDNIAPVISGVSNPWATVVSVIHPH